MVASGIIFIAILALIFAYMEIQIEGKHGWAENLPCWKIKSGLLVKLLGGRPLTGYHLSIVLLVISFLHFPFVFVEWSMQRQLFLLGLLFEFWVVEDFLWFLLNPYYGLKRFKKGQIWWHKTWWGPVPDFYWWFTALSVVFITLSQTI